MRETVTQSKTEACERACALAAQASAEHGRCVLLVPTYDDQVRLKHALAESGRGFGVAVETVASWATDLWEMYGDGRAFSSSVDRALYVRRAFKDYLSGEDGGPSKDAKSGAAGGPSNDGWAAAPAAAGCAKGSAGACASVPVVAPIELTPGMEKLIARTVRMAPTELIAADKAPCAFGLTPPQRAAVAVAARARRLMAHAGLIEQARACDYLAEWGVVAGLRVVVLECETVAAEDRLLATAETQVVRAVAETASVRGRAGELNALVQALYRPDFEHPVEPTGAVRFAYPAGEYASPQLLADGVIAAAKRANGWEPRVAAGASSGDAAAEATGAAGSPEVAEVPAETQPVVADGESAPENAVRVAIVARDALATYEAVAARLVRAGARVQVGGMVAFPKTPFGRAWTALLDFALTPGRPNVLEVGDFALSAFAAMDVRDAYALDARLRGWRGETVDEALTDLTAWTDDDWRDCVSALADGDVAGALEAQKRWIASRFRWPEAYRMQQMRTVEGAQDVHMRAAALGLDARDALEILHELVLPYEVVMEPVDAPAGRVVNGKLVATTRDGEADADDERAGSELDGPEGLRFVPAEWSVRIGTMAQLATEPVASWDVVAIADLDAESYPLRDEEASVDALLQALGAWKPARRVEKLRLRFARCVALARGELVLHRKLNTADASELRPAALVEELVDCYRHDPRDPSAVDKVTGLTPGLMAFCAQMGEEDLERLVDPAGEPAPADLRAPVYSTGWLDAADTGRVLLPGRGQDGVVLPWPVLSPSAIEKYLECPYKWFADRRLRLESVDAELGPIAFGNFAHAVLQRLHDQLRAAGMHRVTPQNLAECEVLLDTHFERLLAEQLSTYDSAALIPQTPLEELEVEAFHRNLHDYLAREAELLPDFDPYGQEVRFGEDEPFEYAGVKIRGSIDRVDVDLGGRAVVIDYKNSVGDQYCFRPKDDTSEAGVGGQLDVQTLPRKVQTLIYAQVVRRKLHLEPVGAIYIAYGKKPGIAGLYDRRVLSADEDLLGIDAQRCGTTEMLEVLDRCEALVAERLRDMAAGRIEPAPCDGDACTYCPAVQCTVRDAMTGKGAM